MFSFKRLKQIDVPLLIIIVILMIIGGMNVFSTTYFPEKEASSFFINQMVFYFVGFGIMIGLASFDYKSLKSIPFQTLIYLVTVTLLVLVLIIGEEIYGARRWISLPGFTLQPAEVAKIALIIITAFILTKPKQSKIHVDNQTENKVVKLFKTIRHWEIKKLIKYFKQNVKKNTTKDWFIKSVMITVVLVSFIGLIFMENSLGNSLITLGIFVLMYGFYIKFDKKLLGLSFLALFSFICFEIIDINYGIELLILLVSIIFVTKYLHVNVLITTLVIIASLFSAYLIQYSYDNLLQDYQRARVESFLEPENPINETSNWNRKQSIIACGSGTFAGKGFLQGTQSNYKFLPFSYTDFAYCSFGEQFGAIGSIFLLIIYSLLLFRIISIAYSTEDKFGQLICLGVGFMILLNTFQHIGMNLGKLPITGVPLPLISYGESYTISYHSFELGLVFAVNAASENKISKVRKLVKG